MEVVIASANKNKYKEIASYFKNTPIKPSYGGVLCVGLNVEETGHTYKDNALLKAQAWAKATGLPALADDSGLEVACLKGAPGIRSARVVAGNDTDKIRWLLNTMSGCTDRRARFIACLVLVIPNIEKGFCYTTGVCRGKIIDAAAGVKGFGYDPVFIPLGYTRTFAELGETVKMKISHRGKAVKKMAQILKVMI